MADEDQLADDLASFHFQHGVDHTFWRLHQRDGARLFIWMFAADDQKYLLALDCDNYYKEPIGGRFVDETSLQCVSSAWPTGDGTFEGWVKFQNGNLFICWDQDRYGIGHHPEWRPRRAWERTGNPLCAYLEFIRCLLNNPSRGYSRSHPA